MPVDTSDDLITGGSFSHDTHDLLSIASIYMACVGLGLIFAPQRFDVGAVPTDPSAALIAYLRLFGSPFLGIAVLNWMARSAGALHGAQCHHRWQHCRIRRYSCVGSMGDWPAARGH
ncbi:MAG TPA: hypothetical protein VF182_02095 [Candidatus Binatia bacterium]